MSSDLFDTLVPLLSEETLERLSGQTLESPLCRLKLWYYDTSAPCCYFLGDGLTETERRHLLETGGRNALSDLWEGEGTLEIEIGLDESSAAFPLLAELYEMMCSTEGDRTVGEEASRTLAQRVAGRLNQMDLMGHCRVTDDFVVYAQNGTDYGCDVYDDICASIPDDKRELLCSRGLLGPGEEYDRRPGHE